MMTHLLAAVLATGLSGTDSAASTGEASVEDAARAFRIQVYQTFRLDRDEFDRRRAEWHRLEQAWIAAGKPDSEAHLLVNWLEEATEQSKSDSTGPLPELPKIAVTPKTGQGESAIWRMFSPGSADVEPKSSDAAGKSATTQGRESLNSTDDVSSAVTNGDSAKTTPVSSRRSIDDPTAGEKTPNETAPVPSSAVTPTHSASHATISSSARANAPAAVWYHRFERWLSEEIDDIAPDPASQDPN